MAIVIVLRKKVCWVVFHYWHKGFSYRGIDFISDIMVWLTGASIWRTSCEAKIITLHEV